MMSTNQYHFTLKELQGEYVQLTTCYLKGPFTFDTSDLKQIEHCCLKF